MVIELSADQRMDLVSPRIRRACMTVALFSIILIALPTHVPSSYADTKEAAPLKDVPNDVSSGRGEFGAPFRMLNGMETMRADPYRIAVYRGSATDNAGVGIIQIPRTTFIDIRKTGVLGRDDVATPQDVLSRASELEPDDTVPNGYRARYRSGSPLEGKPISGWYHVLYLGSSGGEPGTAMLTRQFSSMRLDRPGDARPPPQYVLRRHSPAAHYFDPVTGFRPMVCTAWPQPICRYTILSSIDQFRMLRNGVETKPAMVDAQEWMPPGARILYVRAVITARNGIGGAYLKSLRASAGELEIGYVNRPDDKVIAFVEIATNSRHQLGYRVDDGVSLDLYAVGFSMLQPF
jgi:hypothetical protein